VAFALAQRGPALVALLVLVVIEAGYALALAQVFGSGEQRDYARIGLLVTIAGFAIFLIVAAVQYQLARRLGNDGAPMVASNLGLWIGLTLIYGIASIVWSTVSSMIAVQFSTDAIAYPLAIGAMRVAFQVAMFAVLVRSVAAAHSGNRVPFARIWSILWSERIGWLGIYAALAAAIWLAIWFGGMAVRPLLGDSATIGSLPGALLGAIGQIVLILYAIAVYRACGDASSEATTFT
jgi:hypothetical protein